MAAENFAALLPRVLKHEGGYIDHPLDPGGATNLGVTIRTLSDWLGRPATKAEVRALTVEKVAPIYRKRYWNAVNGDRLAAGVDYATFDAAVNSGPARAKKWLIRAVGSDDHAVTVRRYCEIRRSFLRGLKTFQAFGKGWMRRVAEVEAHGVAMAMAAAGVTREVIAETLAGQAPRNEQKAKVEFRKAAGSGTGAAGTGAVASQPDVIGADPTSLIIFGLVAAVLVVVAVIAWRNARAEREVARAYAAKAQEIVA